MAIIPYHRRIRPIRTPVDAMPTDSSTPQEIHGDPKGEEPIDSPDIPDPAQKTEMSIFSGSHYLSEQERRVVRSGTVQWWIIVLALGFTFFFTFGFFFLRMLGIQAPKWWVYAGLAIILMSIMFNLPKFERYVRLRNHFFQGRTGEDDAVALLSAALDSDWSLFRNVVLPPDKDDIDAVLLGPKGVFALEIKAYSGLIRNREDHWEYYSKGQWEPLDKNPGKQARRNAARLAGFLRSKGIPIRVEARVVWAGANRLLIEKPRTIIWMLKAPHYIRKDLEPRTKYPPEQIIRIRQQLIANHPEISKTG